MEAHLTSLAPGEVRTLRSGYSNEEHGWKNRGPERAEYFVIALGQEN